MSSNGCILARFLSSETNQNIRRLDWRQKMRTQALSPKYAIKSLLLASILPEKDDNAASTTGTLILL